MADSLIMNMGLFWKRSDVLWGSQGRGLKLELLGVPAKGKRSDPINFCQQAGIYALYDESYRLIYVGQAIDGDQSCLGFRLNMHRYNHLAGRWQLFSWFGLKSVNQNRTLRSVSQRKLTTASMLDALEGICIEISEPSQNQRGGDFGKSCHQYLQFKDERLGLQDGDVPKQIGLMAKQMKALSKSVSDLNKGVVEQIKS